MKAFYSSLVLSTAISVLMSCSGSQFEEDVPQENSNNPPPGYELPVEDPPPTLNDLGYATTANATLVVKSIESYEGSDAQAYYINGFLGESLRDKSISTSASTRILMDPDSLRIYVLYRGNNFTILGWNGPQRPSTVPGEFLVNDYYVTPIRIDYSINDQQLTFKSVSWNYTGCSYDGWGRSAELVFDGLYNATLNGYEGDFVFSEGPGEGGYCVITCTGTMELLLDE